MVRLGVNNYYSARCILRRFNSSMVRLGASNLETMTFHLYSFNSSMVRLGVQVGPHPCL